MLSKSEECRSRQQPCGAPSVLHTLNYNQKKKRTHRVNSPLDGLDVEDICMHLINIICFLQWLKEGFFCANDGSYHCTCGESRRLVFIGSVYLFVRPILVEISVVTMHEHEAYTDCQQDVAVVLRYSGSAGLRTLFIYSSRTKPCSTT